ncbi:MAG: TonB-dependent receptor [Bacteroidota bacterium]|nr:TonB-dependent receptor [Bacteroidota bacterium]
MKKTFILCFFVVLTFQFLRSQEKADSVAVNLSELQVNATRNKLYSEMGRVLTVVDKAEISRIAVQSIDQLLDYVVGLDIRQRGTNGAQADISVHGGSFDQVLVLLNGVNITDPQTGHFNLDIPLNLSDVSRVEILEGSSARVLGPNAFSGAINIVTENREKHALNAELEGGSFNYFAQSVSGSAGTDRFHTFASVSHKSSSGYMANTGFDLSSAYLQSAFNTGKVGKFNLQLAAQLKAFGANGFYSLAFPNQYENSKTFLAALDWTKRKGHLEYSTQAYWRRHHDRFELDFNKPAGWNYHLTDVTGGKATVAYLSKLGRTTLGLDLRNEHIFSNVLGTPRDSMRAPLETKGFFTRQANRLLSTGYMDQTLNLKNWYFSLGIASTYASSFGLNTFGGVDLAYAFNENVRVFADANSAVRLPTFTDLYYVGPQHIANPDLQPEHSQTIELGTKIQQPDWKLDVVGYYRLGQHVIDWVKPGATANWISENLTKVNALGTDISFEYYFHQSFIRKVALSYSYLQSDKSASNFISKYALDYLKNKVVLTVDHSIWKNLSASWKAAYLDRAGNYDANRVYGAPSIIEKFTPYVMLDGRLIWSQKKVDIFADVNNILNSAYADYGGLTQPGIGVNAGIRLKLN